VGPGLIASQDRPENRQLNQLYGQAYPSIPRHLIQCNLVRNNQKSKRLFSGEAFEPRRKVMAEGSSTSRRGFASMDGDRQREIASKGGKSVPAEKRSFSQDRELASEAGRKGGQASGTTRGPQD
jgi:general stress protein YciG